MSKSSFIVFAESQELVACLSLEQKGVLLDALFAYNASQELPKMDSMTEIVFISMRQKMDVANQKYADTCEKNRENGQKGGRPSKTEKTERFSEKPKKTERLSEETEKTERLFPETQKTLPDTDTDSDTEPEVEKREEATPPREKSRFAPPTPTEVRIYANEHGLVMDCERFVDFYTSKGWLVGNAKMKDWKAAARNWASRDRPKDHETRIDYNDVLNELDRIRLSSG